MKSEPLFTMPTASTQPRSTKMWKSQAIISPTLFLINYDIATTELGPDYRASAISSPLITIFSLALSAPKSLDFVQLMQLCPQQIPFSANFALALSRFHAVMDQISAEISRIDQPQIGSMREFCRITNRTVWDILTMLLLNF
ncbi:hypothetical protein SS50377_25604 [Spironucleus salmonicida]|uniref:Uncharacterized protein n=1 Tax=Spironucleus salmonicida TaxID=348837 RepID=A0A9P8LNQ1_9EUKA|nr:hypothetical protein SS50377_25604 [Spironucleus salmonicida]